MNLQDELSRNARLSGEIAEQKIREEKRREQEEAERIALEITANIKSTLLENVRQGKYTKQYNKGTAECYFAIPHNRYLKLNAATTYNRKHIRTSLSYQFSVKTEYAAEFEHLRNILNAWGRENQVIISWVVCESGCLREYSFPSQKYHSFAPNDFNRRLQLSVKVVTHFAVDTNLPIDYMSAEDIADQERKTQACIEYNRNQYTSKRKNYIMFGLSSLLIALFAVICFIMELYGLGLLELFMSILFGLGAYSSYDDCRISQANLENESSSK